METLQITRKLITPDIAKKYLESNVMNRLISQPKVLRYADDMKNGKWKEETGELIKISKFGRLLDGQHRLEAVIKSKCSIYFYISFNVDESVFDVLDTGKSRNASDCFRIAGVKLNNTIPSIIAQYNLLEDGRKYGQQANAKSTNAELLQQYYENELFWQNVAKNAHKSYIAFAKILAQSTIGGFYAHFYNINPDKAYLFINQLTTGSDISNNTIAILRNKLMQDKLSPRKMTMTLKMALIIKTWNYFMRGETVKVLKFDIIRDEFPIAINAKSK